MSKQLRSLWLSCTLCLLAPCAAALEDFVAASPVSVSGSPRALVADSSGARYVVGNYYSTLDFNPGVGIEQKYCYGGSDIFVTRINNDGTYAWTRTFVGVGDQYAYAALISGSVLYLTGSTSGNNAGFDTPGSINSLGLADTLVLALNLNDGSPATAFSADGIQTFGGGGNDEPAALAIAGTTLFVAGSFDSANAGIGGAGALASLGSIDAYVLALNTANGAAVAGFGAGGVVIFTGANDEYARGLAVSGGVLYAAGSFNSLDAGLGALGTLARQGGPDAFILALNPANGSAVAAFGGDGIRQFGGVGSDSADAVEVANGVVYVAGSFDAEVRFEGGAVLANSVGGTDVCVLALKVADGALETTFSADGLQTFSGSSNESAKRLTALGSDLFVLGNYASGNAGVGGAGNIAANGLPNIFVLRLNSSGSAVTSFGGDGVQTYCGDSNDEAAGQFLHDGKLWFSGVSYSPNGGVGALGSYDHSATHGILVPLLLPGGLQHGAPTVTSITPDSGPGAGGTGVTISGTGFVTGAAVRFGTIAASAVSVLNATQLTCSAPAGATPYGPVDLVVINPDGSCGTRSSGFSYDGIAPAPITRGEVNGLAIDAAGNRYVAGRFLDSKDFNPSVGLALKTSRGSWDAFVTRFNADGSYAWTQTFGGNFAENAADVVVSGTTLYVLGDFQSTNFTLGAATISTSGGQDGFVVALNCSDGSVKTSFGGDGIQTIGGTQTETLDKGLASGGVLYLTGRFNSANTGLGGTGALATAGGNDAFVLALNESDGAALASFSGDGFQTFRSTSHDSLLGLCLEGSTLYACGSYAGNSAGIGAAGAVNTVSADDAVVIALKVSDGTAQTSFSGDGIQRFCGNSTEFAQSALVSGGVLYVTGKFSSSNAGLGASGAIRAAGSADAFVIALDTNGAAVNAFSADGIQTFGGSDYDDAKGICVVGSTLYITGQIASNNAGFGGMGTISQIAAGDAYVAALKVSDGSPEAAFSGDAVQLFGGSLLDYGDELKAFGTTLYLSGYSWSSNAGLSGAGAYNALDWNAFLLPLDAVGAQIGAPTLSAVVPDYGPVSGGTAVTLIGTGFQTGATVKFGAQPASSATVLSATQITCTTPPSSDTFSRATVVVTNSDGSSSSLPQGFSYDGVAPQPVVQGQVQAVALDGAGNRYIAGTFTGSVDFNPGTGVSWKTSAGVDDVFVTRFNADGSYGWTQIFGGSTTDRALGIAVAGGVVYVVGQFASANAGIGGLGNISVVGGYDAFVLAVNAADGAPVSGFSSDGVQTFGGNSNESASGVTVAGGSIFVCGAFQSPNAGLGGAGAFSSTAGSQDGFVLALMPDGTAAPFGSGGLQTLAGNGWDACNAIAAYGGTLYVAGQFSSNNLGVGATGGISANGGSIDVVLFALNSAGALLAGFSGDGIQTFGGSGDDVASSIAVSNTGTVYVAGSFDSTDAQFGGVGGAISRVGWIDAFVLALDNTGAPLPTFSGDGVQMFAGASIEYGNTVAVSDTGTVFLTGEFNSLNAGVGGLGAVAANGQDAFVLAVDSSGALLPAFSGDGVQIYSGSGNEWANAAAYAGGLLFVAGNSSSQASTNAGVGGIGSYNEKDWGGFLLGLEGPAGTQSGAPALTSLNPDNGPATGGTTVTINGSGFVNGATVKFGTQSAPGVTFVNATRIDCVSPPNLGSAYGSVTVSVTNPDGLCVSLANAFTYDGVVPVPITTCSIRAIAVDGSGRYYVTGEFWETVDFNPRSGTTLKSSVQESADVFVTCFEADGAHVWTQVFGGANNEAAYGLTAAGGVVYVVGYFSSTDARVGGAGAPIAANWDDGFVLALNAANGAPVNTFGADGVVVIGSSGYDYVFGVAVSGSDVYLCGMFDTNDLAVDGGAAFPDVPGGLDVFILALDSTGAAKPAFAGDGLQTFGGSGFDSPSALTIAGGRLYVAGTFNSDDAGFSGLGAVSSVNFTDDAFVLALDLANGTPAAAFDGDGVQTFGGNDFDFGSGLVVVAGTLYICGNFYSVDAGIGSAGTISITNPLAALADGYILALNTANGGPVATFSDDGVQVLAGDNADEISALVHVAGVLYGVGLSTSNNLGIGGPGRAVANSVDACILAVNAADGSAVSSFSDDGLQSFGGSDLDYGYCLAANGTTLLASGEFFSNDAGLGGLGDWDSTGWYGFVLPLTATGLSPLAPTLTNLNVPSGPTSGATAVTLTGTNFAAGASVRFGNAAASTIVVVNATTITCSTPAHTAACVDITVANPDGHTGTREAGFTYLGAPIFSLISPESGTHLGGTSVSIEGRNFLNGTTVTFGGTPGASISVLSSTRITCTTPAHSGGSVALVLSTSAGSASSQGAFTYTDNAPTDIALSAANVAESQAAGATVGILSSSDPDAGDTFSYSLVAGSGSTDNSAFTTRGNALQLAVMLDYEAGGTRSIRVRSTSAGGAFYDEVFTITVTNVNETPASLNLSASSIAENEAAGTLIGTLSAVDPDLGDTCSFSLSPASADAAFFSISGTALKTAVVFDFETRSSYSLVVQATDTGGLTLERSCTLTVGDVVAPVLQGPFTVTATKGMAFSHTIQLSGTQPIALTAIGLPAGLTLSGSVIAGTPIQSGAVDVALTASNSDGSDTESLRISISNPGGTIAPPTFSSLPSATPNPASVGEGVSFSAAASDPDSELLGYQWEFGDGIVAYGASALHAYAASGIYDVTVTVSDGTNTIERSLTVAVNPSFATGEAEMVISQALIKLNFAKGSSDSLKLSGTLPVQADFAPKGKPVRVVVGGLSYAFTLNERGYERRSHESFKLSGRLQAGSYRATQLKFRLMVQAADLAADLVDLGFTDEDIADPPKAIEVPIIVSVDGAYLAQLKLSYAAQAGKHGVAKPSRRGGGD